MNRFFTRIHATALAPALFLLWLFTGTAQAAGYAIIEHSVTGLGNAFAGGAAIAADSTTIFFNPAGMTRLRGTQFTAGAHIIIPSADFENQGSTILTGAPLTGTGEDAGVNAFVPNLYYVRDINPRTKFGIGINAPFGLATKYGRTWVGRYHADKSELKTVNINPSLAYRVNDQWSIGAGIDVVYAKAKLSNAVDFGTICLTNEAALGGLLPNGTCASGLLGAVLTPQGNDGYAEVEGDDWNFGINFGLLWEANSNTRIGLSYRSQSKHTLEGEADFTVPASATAFLTAVGSTAFRDTDASANMTLPDSLSVSVFHQINSNWAVMGDITWTNWSVFDELRIEFDNLAQPDSVVTTDWNDSNRYSIGIQHTSGSRWICRAGIAYDETPVPNAARRTPRIPGEDRLWLAFGFSYVPSDRFSFDVGYTHLFIDDAKINKTATGEDAVRGALVGRYEADVDILSAQLNWRF